MKLLSSRSLALLIAVALLLVGSARRSQAEPADHEAATPEKILPLTKEQLLDKVPQFYCFDYHAEPQPGKRYWMRVDNHTWIERYPDGLQSRFKVLGHITAKGMEGTLVVKVAGSEEKTGADNQGDLQAFIPDKDSETMHHLFRSLAGDDTSWHDLGQMQDVE